MPHQGAQAARSGYLYQDTVAVEFMLKMLTDDRIKSIKFEELGHFGDLVINYVDKNKEYIQIKARIRQGNWTVKLLNNKGFWANFRSVLHNRFNRITLVCESPFPAMSEIIARNNQIQGKKEFRDDINRTQSLKTEIEDLLKFSNITWVTVKSYLSRLNIEDAHGSQKQVLDRCIAQIGETAYSVLYSKATEYALNMSTISRDDLREALNRSGITQLKATKPLLLVSVETLLKNNRAKIEEKVLFSLKSKYVKSLFVPRTLGTSIISEINNKDLMKLKRIDILYNLISNATILAKIDYPKWENTLNTLDTLKENISAHIAYNPIPIQQELEELFLKLIGDKKICTKYINKSKQILFNVTAIVAKAGMGKSNLLADIALSSSGKHLTSIVFASELHLSDEYSLENCIKEQLGLEREISFKDFAHQANAYLRETGKRMILLIDGINESDNYDLFKKNIERLSLDTLGLNIDIFITCRDVFWNSFFYNVEDSFTNYLANVYTLDVFSDSEFRKAFDGYLYFYRIKINRLSNSAYKDLRHPLLLRFFCETYSSVNRQTNKVTQLKDIRLKKLFDQYWDKKSDAIRHSLHHRSSVNIDNILLNLANKFLQTNERWISIDQLDELKGTQQQLSDSMLTRILDEDIILERSTGSGMVYVTFVYEEFMEYMMARALIRETENLSQQEIVTWFDNLIVKDQKSSNFPTMLRYLMVMIYESKKIPVWQNVIHRKLTWSINALRAIQQINADDWDDSAANTICEIAKAGYFFGLPDCDDDILELCELSGKKYPEQIATALKYIVAISPFSGIVEEAINLLVKKAVYDNNKFAWDVICSMIDALTSMVEIYQSLGKKYSPELTERINTLIKIKDRQQNCIITSKIDKRTISNSLTTVLIQANDIFDNIYYRELYCIELLGSRKSYFANS